MDCGLPGSFVHRIFQQEYWNGLPFPSPGDLPDPRMEPVSPAFLALAGSFFTPAPPGKTFRWIVSFFFIWGMLHSMQDLSSQTRDWTQPPALAVQSLNHWTTKEVPMVRFRWGLQMRIKVPFFLDHNVKLSLALSTNVRQRATFQTFPCPGWLTSVHGQRQLLYLFIYSLVTVVTRLTEQGLYRSLVGFIGDKKRYHVNNWRSRIAGKASAS